MAKYLIDFVDKDGGIDCGIVAAENLDDATRDGHRIVERNNGIVTNVMLWSDAVLATMDPDDYIGKGER